MSSQSSPQGSTTCTCKNTPKIHVRRFYSQRNEERQELIRDKNYINDYSSFKKPNGDLAVRPLDPVNRVTLTWFNINVRVKTKQKKLFDFIYKNEVKKKDQILYNVNGEVRPGTLLAIMGASGAGKTTLLNVLTRRNLRQLEVKGEVQVNGQVVEGESIAGISAYVQQNDLFIGTLTVHEHLVFQALLRMDRHLSYQDRMRRVDEVIREMGLSKCKNTKIGVPGKMKGISGGEAKRLALAAEVLTNPSLMFCDEPTSGLDSFMSRSIVSLLRQMAEGGRTIICTIHQPSSEIYGLFDNLLLMAEGRVAYKGKADKAIEFFKRVGLQCPINYNPADFFVTSLAVVPGKEAESRVKIKKICEQFAKEDFDYSSTTSSRNSFLETYPQTQSRFKASWLRQFRAVLWRSWISTMRQQILNKVRIIQIILIAVLFGLLFWQQENDEYGVQNINGAMFSMILTVSFQNMSGVINVLKMEEPLFLREYWNGMYRVDVYFLAKTITQAPFIIFLTIIYSAILYSMIGLNSSPTAFLLCVGILILVADAGASFGYMVSCISSSLNIALTLFSPLSMPLMIAGGFYLNADSVPTYLIWLKYISWFYYGNEALTVNQWKDVTNITCYTEFCPHSGKDVLDTLSFHEENLLRDIILIFLLMIFYRLLAFFALQNEASKKT